MVGFALAGGASLGAIEVGMLQALYEHRIAPELIVGTSAGAVNGAYIASRPPTPKTAGDLASRWESMTTLKVFPLNPVSATLGLIGVHDYLVPNTTLKRELSSQLQFKLMQDAPTKFAVITTDVLSGAKRPISSGDAELAVLASAAIPGVFPSIEFEGRRLVDGGVAENTPIADAVVLGADPLYVLPTGYACALRASPRSALGMLVHTQLLLINQRLVQDIEQYSQVVRLVVFPPPCPNPVSPIDFSQAAWLIEQSHRLATEVLDGDRPDDYWREQALARLRPHRHD